MQKSINQAAMTPWLNQSAYYGYVHPISSWEETIPVLEEVRVENEIEENTTPTSEPAISRRFHLTTAGNNAER